MLALLLLLGLPTGELPAELKQLPDPADQWVGRIGVGLSPDSLHLDGQALPRWGQTPEAGYYAPLVAELEGFTQKGREAAGDKTFVGELYIELAPETTAADLFIVLGSAERAGFKQFRVALEGQPAQAPRSVQVGLRPGKGQQVQLRGDMAWMDSAECSLRGAVQERVLAIPGPVQAQEFLPWLQGEEGRLMLAEGCAPQP